MKKALALFAVLTLIAPYAFAAEKTIIILPFEGGDSEGKYKALADGIPEMLKATLTPYSESIAVMERADLDKIMDEQGLNSDHDLNRKTIPKTGQLKQAHFLLKGSYFVTGDTLHIQANLFDTENTGLVKSVESQSSVDDLQAGCSSIAQQLAEKNTLSEAPPLALTENYPVRNQTMIEGIGYFYNGAYNQAIPAFMKVLKVDAGNDEARFWLARSYYKAGLTDNARIELLHLSKQQNFSRINDVQKFLKDLEQDRKP